MSAARAIALRDKRTIGQVVSDLARKGLERRPQGKETCRNGVPVLPHRGVIVTTELVNALRDEEW